MLQIRPTIWAPLHKIRPKPSYTDLTLLVQNWLLALTSASVGFFAYSYQSETI
ncbi:hypothetical protein TERTU_2216 [Teredinibacter turnerae T7901]|uniref:Uncharacterized protein n=1 Tax=Teredinibacter turnerae (strain ATCC 39867 / T7901) TaxID=377629 RepID=C5BJJ2_TERTT|nr:hypothetical protein TERTU_2216 [Teredinibacter turnerae T7901]